jgi:hypothetical protein
MKRTVASEGQPAAELVRTELKSWGTGGGRRWVECGS